MGGGRSCRRHNPGRGGLLLIPHTWVAAVDLQSWELESLKSHSPDRCPAAPQEASSVRKLL